MTKVNELKDMPDKQVVNSFVGTVEWVGDQEDGKYGPSQRVQLTDQDGEKVSTDVRHKRVFTLDDKGKTFIFKSNVTKSYGLQGVKVDQNGEYTNLKITGAADIAEYLDGEAAPTKDGGARPAQAPRRSDASASSLDAEGLAKNFAAFALIVRQEFVDAGMEDLADQAAMKAPEWGALWWFGQKTVDIDEIPF